MYTVNADPTNQSFLDVLRSTTRPSPGLSPLPVRTQFHVLQGSVDGHVRTLWWPPRIAGPPNNILIFICGNPGIPEWYIEFLSALRNNIHSTSLAILAHGHIGHAHDLPAPKSDTSLSLEAQIIAAGSIMRSLRGEFPNTRLMLMGHSIGGYMAMQVARRCSEDVQSVIGLQPTISHLAETPNGRYMKYLFIPPLPQILSTLARLLMTLFPFILSVLFRIWPKDALVVLTTFVSSSNALYASMTLAGDEMRSVTTLNTALLSRVKPKLQIVYSEKGDGWVGTNYEEVVSKLEDCASNVHFAKVPHAFCIHHSREMAEACIPHIHQFLSE
ncbi:alpha/beta-hydrolase [Serendipita vermifera]|nr:alpha/beta-hydrolase [Serendipita vermifera]